ncbi:MotA/TolQ/ExbB proton channel family protein [Porphyromonas circumdentaria]|uniref:Outer membrane transport energization protein ExbB (TC 2.C.1.1.1) n=1 Tax=Porphyromonas circumdentaria TaxID=29524 RepID=A0A1T4NYC0_9PORP|nr:MotA/TolQ/ExbB proton channel family protein [Porphyromonas circumdentaria]MBB6276225.1 biopolymer transport protein ExbB/TolQ [Porphyromonas circumdentaria]MDO4722302.1 MotA/TolQ/ExbB proton channel family protein [Porphyromonas circumdentaria]SJZ84016.1 outer membrane transport energization protein ExbB (TC 2.C.1.1.1) [Porphyromonas circumdentaria]
MNYISNAMFWVSNGLLVPVVIGLLFLFVRSLLMLGTLFSKWQSYRNRNNALGKFIRTKERLDLEAIKEVVSKQKSGIFESTLLSLLESNTTRRELLIGEYELRMEGSLGSAKILSKFGPILGLMGTLIPMGPALVGLSAGDIESMAYNMQVAFATTVIGMFTSAVGYIALHVLRNYHHRDLIWLDYINESIDQQ